MKQSAVIEVGEVNGGNCVTGGDDHGGDDER